MEQANPLITYVKGKIVGTEAITEMKHFPCFYCTFFSAPRCS